MSPNINTKKSTLITVYDLCSQLLDSSIDSRGVGATDLVKLLAILEEEEGGHSRDAVLSSSLRNLLNVDLVELDIFILSAQLLDYGSDGLAGTTPGSMEVDEDGFLGVVDLLLPLSSALDTSVSFGTAFHFPFLFQISSSSDWDRLTT